MRDFILSNNKELIIFIQFNFYEAFYQVKSSFEYLENIHHL